METIATIGVDPGRRFFRFKPLMRQALSSSPGPGRRRDREPFFSRQTPCLIGLERAPAPGVGAVCRV